MWNTLIPDSDILVLIRLDDEEYPLVIGYHDGERWCTSEGCMLRKPVIGWSDLNEAAEWIDGSELLGNVA